MEGTVTLDGAELPISDDNAMNTFRFCEVSIVPQYAMSAMNPIRKIGRMISELLGSRGVSYDETLPELVRRLELVGLDQSVLDRYPLELAGLRRDNRAGPGWRLLRAGARARSFPRHRLGQ